MSDGAVAPPSVDRKLGWVIAVCGLLATVAAWQRMAIQIPEFAIWWTATAFLPVLLFGVLALWGRRLPYGVLRTLWGIIIVTVTFVQVTTFLGYDGPDPDALRSWAWKLEPAAMGLLPLLVRPAAAISLGMLFPFTTVLSALLFIGRIPEMALAMTPIHVGNIAVLIVVMGVRTRLRRLREVENRARVLEVRSLRARMRLQHQQAIARLVHDDVLSALTAATRLPGPTGPTLRQATATGLASLRVVAHGGAVADPSTGDVDAAVARSVLVGIAASTAPGDSTRIRLRRGTVPAEVLARSSQALAEALRNSATHARTEIAPTVTGRIGDGRLRLVVSDHGAGFNATAMDPERLGVRLSILGRMRDLPGGTAKVSSGSRGTRIEVGWQRVASEVIDTCLSTPTVRIALIGVWITGVVHGLLVGHLPGTGAAPTYAAALIGVLLVTTPRPGSLRRPTALAGIICSIAIAVSVLIYTDLIGARAAEIWLLTFASYIVGVIAARGNTVAGGIGAATILALLGTWGAVRDQDVADLAAMATPILFSLLVGYTWLTGLVIIARKERGAQLAARDAATSAVAADSERWTSRREVAEILHTAESVLTRIAAGDAMDEELVREVKVVEGDIRDRLRAPSLHHIVLAEAVSDARRRGVQVLLLAEEDPPAEQISCELAAAIACVLAQDSASAITVRAFAADGEGVVTVAIQHTGGGGEHLVFDREGRSMAERAGQLVNGQISGT